MGFATVLGVATATAGVVRDVPQVLVYSLAFPALCLLALAAPYALVLTLFGFSVVLLWLALPVAMFLCCLVYCTLQVAMCYEVNGAFDADDPVPFSGLGVAVARPKRILLAALLAVAVVCFRRRLAGFGRVGRVLGEAGSWSYRAASLFAFPLIATTDESVAESLESVLHAVETHWGRGLTIAAGTKMVGLTLAWGGFVLAGVLFAAAVVGLIPRVPPLGRFTLPLVVAAGGFLAGAAAQFLVQTVIKTALFRYVRDGELPVAADADRFVGPSGGPVADAETP